MPSGINSVEQLDAVLSIIATCVPIVLALIGGIFGFQATRGSDRDLPPVTILKLVQHTEDRKRIKRLRQYQYVELVFGVWAVIGAVLYFFGRFTDLLNSAPSTDPAADALSATGIVLLIAFYASLIWPYVRTLRTLWTTPYGVPSPGCRSSEIVLGATQPVIAQRCQYALQRMQWTLREIDLEAGVIKARRHGFFNLYRVYYDDINITLRNLGGEHYLLCITSDGIIPSYRSDARRNQAHIKRFVQYLVN